MTSSQLAPFQPLVKHNIITDAQYQALLLRASVKTMPTVTRPAAALYSLCIVGIVEWEYVEAEFKKVTLRADGVGISERTAILCEVHEMMESAIAQFMLVPLKALQKLGLITAEQVELGAQLRPQRAGGRTISPGVALALLRSREIVSEHQWNQMAAQSQTGSGLADEIARNEILLEAERVFKGGANKHVKFESRAIFRTMARIWMPVILVFGLSLWWWSRPAGVPNCGDADAVATVDRLFFRSAIEQRSDPANLLRNGSSSVSLAMRLSDPREVGYLLPQRTRGCLGTASGEAGKLDVAYTIGFDADKRIVVAGADVEIVKARFGFLDKEGHTTHTAAPVGRDAVEKAFRDGVDEFNKKYGGGAREKTLLGRIGRNVPATSQGMPDRMREIAEVEPLECHAGSNLQSATCNLLIERNDSFLAAIGRNSSQTLTSEFSFVQEGDQWIVSDDFPRQYMAGIAKGRVSALTGK